MSTTLKNYKLSHHTVRQVRECASALGLASDTLAVKVAIAHLHSTLASVDLVGLLVEIRKNDKSSTFEDLAST